MWIGRGISVWSRRVRKKWQLQALAWKKREKLES